MTRALFRDDAYQRRCSATVRRCEDEKLILDQTICYPRGGGQPGDRGVLVLSDGSQLMIVDTTHGGGDEIVHQLEEPAELAEGVSVEVELDWPQRFAHMRMHTALHLLGAVVPYGVTGGNISAARSRLDFDMQETVDKVEVGAALNELVAADHPVLSRWISQQELAAQPELVRTMSVRPPTHVERLRLLEIPGVDLQPCGGTHVRSTAEIGPLEVVKIEKKGRHNRRVHIAFA